MTTTNILVVAAFLIMAGLPFVLSRRPLPKESADEPAVGARNFGWSKLAAGLAATYAGGAALLNIPSIAYSFGWYALVDTISVALALILSGVFIVPFIRQKQAVTLGTFFGDEEKWHELCVGTLSVVVYTLLAAAQILALTTVLSPHLPIPEPAIAVGGALIIAAYIGLYGYRAVTLTDMLQLTLMLLFFGLLLIVSALLDWPTSTSTAIDPARMPLGVAALLALPILFIPTSQDFHIRVHSAKSIRDARLGSIAAAASYTLIGLAGIAAGLWVSKTGTNLNSPDEALSVFLQEVLGPFQVLPTIAIIAAVASSLDSTLFAASTSLTYDVAQPLRNRTLGERKTRQVFGVSTLLILLAAMSISLFAQRILSIILSALAIYVAVLLPMLLAARLRLKSNLAIAITLTALISITSAELVGYSASLKVLIYTGVHALVVLVAWKVSKKDT